MILQVGMSAVTMHLEQKTHWHVNAARDQCMLKTCAVWSLLATGNTPASQHAPCDRLGLGFQAQGREGFQASPDLAPRIGVPEGGPYLGGLHVPEPVQREAALLQPHQELWGQGALELAQLMAVGPEPPLKRLRVAAVVNML